MGYTFADIYFYSLSGLHRAAALLLLRPLACPNSRWLFCKAIPLASYGKPRPRAAARLSRKLLLEEQDALSINRGLISIESCSEQKVKLRSHISSYVKFYFSCEAYVRKRYDIRGVSDIKYILHIKSRRSLSKDKDINKNCQESLWLK